MEKSAKKQRYRLEPPEGGWGYLISLGMILIFVAIGSEESCFGLIFNDFLTRIGQATTAVGITESCTFGAMSFTGLNCCIIFFYFIYFPRTQGTTYKGLFSSTLIKHFGIRRVGIAAGSLYFIGTLIQVFAQSVWYLFLAATVHGISMGVFIPVMLTNFNQYFLKRRAFMISASECIVGLGHVGYPLLVQILLEKYGFRGCLAVLAALHSHIIFSMVAMHPVEWHMKRVPIEAEEREESDIEKANEMEQVKPLITEIRRRLPSSDTMSLKKSIESLNQLKLSESAAASRRASSLASLGNWTSAVEVSEGIERNPKPTGKWQFVMNFLDLSLLKDAVYMNMVLGVTFAFYADMTYLTILPLYLAQLKYSKSDIATIIAIGAGADLVSRFTLAVSSLFHSIPSRYIFLTGAILSLLARYAFLYAYDFWSMAILTALIGFLRTWMRVPLPLVFAEYLPQDRLSSSYGLFMFLQGIIMFIVGPIMGLIRDKTKSYELTFHFLNMFLAACIIQWSVEILWVRCRIKKTEQTSSTRNGNGPSLFAAST